MDALKEALKPDERGPKLKRAEFEARDRLIKKQNEEIDRLKDIIKKKEKQIENLRGKLNLQKNSLPRPLKCPHCGFEKVYKNGTYKIKIDKFLDELKKGEDKEIVVQQFICPYCKSSVHTSEKNRRIILF